MINSDETDGVSARSILDRLDIATHHKDSTLDRLDEEIILLTRDEVGAQDADLLTSADGTGEDTTEGIEATLIGSGDHLGNEEHERTRGIAVTDGNSGFIVERSIVQVVDTVALSNDGGRQVEDQHLKKSISSREPLTHDGLKKRLSDLLELLTLKNNVERLHHLLVLLLIVIHGSLKELSDGLQDELNEGALEGLAIRTSVVVDPLLGGGIEVVITPETSNELLTRDTELLRVEISETSQSETPAVETRTEGDSTLLGVDLRVSEKLILVGGDDDVSGLDGLREVKVGLLRIQLQLKESTIELVNHEDGTDTLGQSLTQDSLSLNADGLDTIDDDEGTISNTQSSRNLRREIDVARRINQVDQESVGGRISRDLVGSQLVVEGDTSGLDGNSTLLLIRAGVHETGLTSLSLGDDTSGTNQRISQSRLSVIDALVAKMKQ